MSRKVGLRVIPSIKGILIVCPAAGIEQFVNDHFQTGDFTGWTQTNMVIDNGTCVNAQWGTSIAPFIGSYDASQGNNNSISLQQNLAKPVPASCLSAASTFQVTTADLGASCRHVTQNLRILYTDGTYTDVTLNPAGNYGWVTYDLRSFVQASKTIKGIIWSITTSMSSPTCNTHVGQVSLKMPAVGSTVIWDDGIAGEGASHWTTTYDETLMDDSADKPDGVHQSMDITVGNDGAFDCYSPALSVDASKYAYVSLWWKGNNTGQTMDLFIYKTGSVSTEVQFIDNFTGWKRVEMLKSAWSNTVQIEVANDLGSGLAKGLVFKIAYVTNNYP